MRIFRLFPELHGLKNNRYQSDHVRWVIIQNYKYKEVKLVARAFDEENLNEIHKDSPICWEESFRLLTTTTVRNKPNVHLLDISSSHFVHLRKLY